MHRGFPPPILRFLQVSRCRMNGGHLAPSLGVVELTLALVSAFDPAKDRLVWDVGHQAYAYKLLTGRLERFHTLRTLGGISGFPRPVESPYDHFGVGHSSTSISAALGMAAKARDIPLTGLVVNVELDRSDPDLAAFTCTIELTGDLDAKQKSRLLRAARACPVRQTLSRRIEFR